MGSFASRPETTLAGTIQNYWLKSGLWVKKSTVSPLAIAAQSARMVPNHQMVERASDPQAHVSIHQCSKWG